ncbi:MAG: hypothetical protein VX237_02040, partial [Chloroflexota bacterium]|nr:hypothetical protein [Chloroflexota bacterium]
MTTNHSSWYASTPWIVGVVFSLIALTLIIVPLGDNTELDLQIGDPAPFDIVAPRSQTYISTLQTESAQAAAENAVSRIYDPPDTRVSRQQISSAKAAIAFIDLTRSNKLATTHQKQQEFTKLGNVNMPDDIQIQLIQIEDARWLVVQEEIIRVIENIMSEPIQEDQMEQIRQRIPVLISVELSIEEAELAAVLVQQFIVPNSLFNEIATNKARDASVDAVEPV